MYSTTQLAIKYLHYYFSASHARGHGVHSPFVFDFIKFVKNDKTIYDCYAPIEQLRKNLLNDTSYIDVQDFGAGSAVLKTNKRMVRKMAASSLKPKKFAQLLYRMVRHYQPASCIELGTSFGISSAYLAMGNTNAKLISMEGSPEIAGIARQNFNALGIKNIQLIEGDFAHTLPALLQQMQTVDFVFIDGNHQKLPTLQYFEMLLPKVHGNSILLFDDIHWSQGMEEAWEQIRQHPSVTLSLDLFFIGILFFKPDFKVKQHYSLRF